MSLYEYILGGILIVAAVLIVVLTLMQQQKGEGLSAAIVGDKSMMAAGKDRSNEAKLATATKILGVVFFVVTVVLCVLSARL